MKKMMLNEHYGLETATFNGSKIRTSRIEFQSNAKLTGMTFYTKQKSNIHFALFDFDDGKSYQSRYGIGEIVAIAQSYEDAENVIVKKIVSHTFIDDDKILLKKLQSIVSSPGVGNKMFPKLMLNESYGWNGTDNSSFGNEMAMSYQIYREMIHKRTIRDGVDNTYSSETLSSNKADKLIVKQIK